MSKPDPKLVKTKVVIAYTASDKYSAEFTHKSGKGQLNLRTGEELPPQLSLLEGLEELARLTALFGFEDEALERFNAVRQRVADFKAKRAA